jgi:hypothetical protein
MRHFVTEFVKHPNPRERRLILNDTRMKPAEPGGKTIEGIGKRPAHKKQCERDGDQDLDSGMNQ